MEVNNRIGKILRGKILPIISVFAVAMALTNMRSANGGINTLPTDGGTIAVTISAGGPDVTISLVGVTYNPGKYTNDPSVIDAVINATGDPGQDSLEDPDFDILATFPSGTDLLGTGPRTELSGSVIEFYPLDYGGSITIRVESTVGEILESFEVTIPADSDSDGLPNAWEDLFVGDLTRDGDIDTSAANSFVGDGLTNFEEYRGSKWGTLEQYGEDIDGDGNLDIDEDVNDNGVLDDGEDIDGDGKLDTIDEDVNGNGFLDSLGPYQTVAYVPQSTAVHFRTNPNRKDLFVKYFGYGSPSPPFAIGSAFGTAEIDVHALNASGVSAAGTANIDVLLIINNTTGDEFNLNGGLGHIDKKSGVRNWNWATKGGSNIGGGSYGTNCTTYLRALNAYFDDKPYIDGCYFNRSGVGCNTSFPHPNGILDPIELVEDLNDNGEANGKDKRRIIANGVLDGDLYIADSFSEDLNPFDIDNDGMVELGNESSDPNSIDPNTEYTKAQVLKHVITHEIGHAVGMIHITDPLGLMHEYSEDWSRDNFFTNVSRGKINIHNN